MLTSHDQRIDALLKQHIVEPHVAPGACAAVALRDGGVWLTLSGQSGRFAPDDPTTVTSNTWFDLASLTKPVVAFCVARYVDRGDLDGTAAVSHYLGWAEDTAVAKTPVEALLSHRAGLAAHVELFAPLRDGTPFDPRRALRSAANSLADERRPLPDGGFEVIYSDLGYILLGKVLEEVAGAPLDEVICAELGAVGVPALGSVQLLGLRASGQVAPTETVPWRGGRLSAVVHDENAFALSGRGCSGHAGLFGRLEGVVGFAQLMLDLRAGRKQCLSSRSVDWLLRRRPGGEHRGGFDAKTASQSSAGNVLSPETFGHLGFTGTSFWCDPAQELAIVLLTNRVCPSRDNIAIRQARPIVHDALATFGLGGIPSSSSPRDASETCA